MADRRALVPVVGKALEVGLLVLLVALLTATLFGGAVPAYRATVGEEVGGRTLQHAASEVAAATVDAEESEAVTVRMDVSLPDTIRGASYRIRGDGATLTLDHPHPDVGGRTRLVLPRGTAVTGTWRSDRRTVVRVSVADDRTEVELMNS